MKNLAICFLTFVALNGCVKKQANPLDPKDLFDVVEKVEGSVITELPCMPSESFIIDSLLIFVTRYCDYNFAILNLNSFEIIRRFGRQGKGPGEYYTGNLIGRVDDSRYFQTFDVLNKMHTYNLDSLLDYEGYKPLKTMDNKPLRDFMNIARLSDSLYVGLGLFEHGMIGVIRNNQFDNAVMNFPIKREHETLPANLLGIAYQGDIKSHPHKPMFCIGFARGSIFQVYSVKNNKITRKYELITELPDIEHVKSNNAQTLVAGRETQYGYMHITVTGEYIFALYSGKFEKGKASPYYPKNLLVFDWKGNPVKYFVLDQGISVITVDQNNRFGYGINRNAELVKFGFEL